MIPDDGGMLENVYVKIINNTFVYTVLLANINNVPMIIAMVLCIS